MVINLRKKFTIILVGAFITLSGLFLVIELLYSHVRAGNMFSHMDFPESFYFLYDIGVADVNSDGVLDIFTSNHFALQHVMFGDGSGGYTDSLAGMRLYQDAEFPGIEDMGNAPEFRDKGVYIYWHKNTLNIINNNAAGESSIEGQLLLNSEVMIGDIPDIGTIATNVEVRSEETTSGATSTTVGFQLSGGESFQLAPELVAIPIKISIDKNYALSKLFVGPQSIIPQSHDFNIVLRDRHGMAWSDFTGDGLLDLFVVRGGLKGRMLQQPENNSFKDELLVNTGGRFENITGNSGIKKYGCSGHQTAWVDFNNDSKLDLYITCRRAGQANQLYMQTSEYFFIDVGKRYNLDRKGRWLGSFIWLDFDQDQDQDLVLEEDKGIWLYVNEQDSFTRQLITSHKGGITKLTAADFDMDNDLDIYAASSNESVLLINNGNYFTKADLAGMGLPLKAETANWVDYDNDGLIDLHVVPGGIYRQQSKNTFNKTGILENIFRNFSVEDARATWFDLDNDGDRDLVMAVKYKPSPAKLIFKRLVSNKDYNLDWSISLYKNLHPDNHWLQVKLVGPEENRQAIGARVILENEDGTLVQQMIGQAEGSHSSQGHYRLYFGLGASEKPKNLRVVWADGRQQTFVFVPDKIVTIEYD